MDSRLFDIDELKQVALKNNAYVIFLEDFWRFELKALGLIVRFVESSTLLGAVRRARYTEKYDILEEVYYKILRRGNGMEGITVLLLLCKIYKTKRILKG